MAILQTVERITNVIAHTNPTSSPDIRNIWQCMRNSTRVRQGCSWHKLCYSCFLGPARGYEKQSAKVVWTKPVPGCRKKPHLVPEEQRGDGGGGEEDEPLFSCSISVLSTLLRMETTLYLTQTAKQTARRLSVWGVNLKTNGRMKMNFAHYYGGRK